MDLAINQVGHTFFLLDETIASRAVFVIVSGSDGWTGRNVFEAS